MEFPENRLIRQTLLKEERENKNISQEEFAKILCDKGFEITKNTYVEMENGRKEIPDEVLIEVYEAEPRPKIKTFRGFNNY